MVNVVLSSWPRGDKGAKKSLEKVAEFVSRDRLDFRTREWTINQLIAAGNPQTDIGKARAIYNACLLYTSPSPRDRTRSRMPSSA